MAETCVTMTPPWVEELRREVRWRLAVTGLTCQDLADHLGSSVSHISQVLAGTSTGSTDLLDRMAGAMGLRISVTVTGAPAVRTTPLNRSITARELHHEDLNV